LAATDHKRHETARVRPASDTAGGVNTPARQGTTVFGSDPLDELVLPDGTHVKEHDLVTDGNVLIGGQSTVELGVRGGSVVAGERVTVGGDIEADGDCRLDMWCEVDGNVLVGSDAYLGERVHIAGQLIVSGDLDIGDDVDIEEGFEANGWIVIRNPMPTIVFLFVYLSHLLRIGEEEAAEDVASEFLADDRSAEPVRIPRGSRVSDDAWRVSTPARIGEACRLHGNIRAADIEVGAETEVFGSLRAKGPIRIGPGAVVHGDVTTRGGPVVVASGVHVRGDVSCDRCELSEAAEVEGTIRAREGITIEDAPETEASEPNADGDSNGTDEAPTAAIVPLGKGELSDPEADAETEPGTDDETGTEPDDGDDANATSAVVPLEESDVAWEEIGDRSSNGTAEDVAAMIAEAEAEPAAARDDE
jgi:predicted acyltransferase (DUF342 family)